MKLLALDTSLDACSVAVLGGDGVLAWRSEPMSRGHQERLAPMAAETMAAAGVSFPELARIAVTLGPGSFTGVRVGLAFAKSLALALGIPCIGIGTLEALAASTPFDGTPVAAVLDGRRGQVYLQAFEPRGRAISPPEAVPIDDAAQRLAPHGFPQAGRLVGSGAHLLAARLAGGRTELGGVDVRAVGRLALTLAPGSAPPQPLYLRAPDAKTLTERLAERPAEP